MAPKSLRPTTTSAHLILNQVGIIESPVAPTNTAPFGPEVATTQESKTIRVHTSMTVSSSKLSTTADWVLLMRSSKKTSRTTKPLQWVEES